MENLKFLFTSKANQKATFEELNDNEYCPNAIKFVYSIGEALGRTDIVSKKDATYEGKTITKYYLSAEDLTWLVSQFIVKEGE